MRVRTRAVRRALAVPVVLGLAAAVLTVPTASDAAQYVRGPVLAAPSAPLADRVTSRKRAVDAEIAEMRETLEGTQQDLVEAVVALKRLEADLADARDDLARAEAEEKAAGERYAMIAGRLEAAQARESAAEEQIRAGQQAMQEARSDLGRIARDAYVNNGGTSQLALTLDATSPEEFAASLAASATALKLKQRAQERLTLQQVTNLHQEDYLSSLRLQTQAYLDEAERVLKAKQAAQDRAAQAQRRIAALVVRQQATVKMIEVRKASEQKRLDDLAAEQKRLQDVLRARAAAALAAARRRGHVVASSGSGFLGTPAAGPITSGFGWRTHPIFHVRRLHTGTDFGVPCGTTVRAAADGTVVLAGWAGGYGNRVVIDHGVVRGVSLATTYNHNSRLLVSNGQRVSRGQAVSISGTTGSSTGCHLHFEVLVNGSYTNPMAWL
ncbi:MAG: M23 family metallopeptidase [Kineosporiaceae bacterium]